MTRLLNWLADTGRFPAGMFYWNIRKSLYAWRGRRGPCPCQNPSDDNVPGRVRCEAILHWHNPARFRKICPLLVETPEGWRCAVPAGRVRPFWGRVAGHAALLLLLLYLGAVTLAFLGLRLVGHAPVSWTQVAWPRQWEEIPRLQSKQLFRQAIDSFGRGRLAEARLALATAWQLDPANYDVALMLSQISMFQRSYAFADGQFMLLWRDHPANRGRTSVVYHDTLLALDRMGKLAEFSVVMAAADRAHASVWIRSALLAARSMPAADAAQFATKEAAAIRALAPHAQQLLGAEFALQAGEEIKALAALHKPFSGPVNPYYTQYQIERLAGLGAAADAQLLLDQMGPLLGDFDHLLNQTALSTLAGDLTEAHAAFRKLLRLPLNRQRLERLATLLIAHPDACLYRELHARLLGDPRFEAIADGATMWITGIVCAAQTEADYWKTHGRQAAGVGYPALGKLDFSSRDIQATDSVGHLVNVLSLPREVILALLWRVAPAPPPPTLPGAIKP
ncbi:MAG: hypothetical protein HYX71_10600 [Opitutae bacterium]|nr:hypothetical protein [Opitutae bacterium]